MYHWKNVSYLHILHHILEPKDHLKLSVPSITNFHQELGTSHQIYLQDSKNNFNCSLNE